MSVYSTDNNGNARIVANVGSGSGGSADFPAGGTTGQALIKASDSDNDVEWGDMPSVAIEKITVNGTEQPISNKTVALTINQSQITQSSLLTLTVAGWDSTTKQQTVALTVNTEKRNVIDITVGELPLWSEYNVYAISESATGITFKCDIIPEEALTFRVTSMEVN